MPWRHFCSHASNSVNDAMFLFMLLCHLSSSCQNLQLFHHLPTRKHIGCRGTGNQSTDNDQLYPWKELLRNSTWIYNSEYLDPILDFVLLGCPVWTKRRILLASRDRKPFLQTSQLNPLLHTWYVCWYRLFDVLGWHTKSICMTVLVRYNDNSNDACRDIWCVS